MRKTLYISMIVLFMLTILLPSITNAHPGRTDSNGGHTCRTNCAKWGLKDGEYHYHNGNGSSSDSNTGSDSGSDSSSGSSSKSDSISNNNSKSTSKSGSNGGETNTSKPKPKPEPKIDKKQIEADEHYEKAMEYFNNNKFHEALEELDKIYELDRSDSKTNELVEKSLNKIYGLAKSNLNDEKYVASQELLNFIVDYERSDDEIIKRSMNY